MREVEVQAGGGLLVNAGQIRAYGIKHRAGDIEKEASVEIVGHVIVVQPSIGDVRRLSLERSGGLEKADGRLLRLLVGGEVHLTLNLRKIEIHGEIFQP